MQFPGFLGVGLFRLRTWLRDAPVAALGPLFGFLAADIGVDLARGRLATVGVELIIGPVIALAISATAQRSQPGLSGVLLLALGVVSALGASVLLALGLGYGVAPTVIIGLRHLAVWAYAWAAIAEEPPPRQRLVLRPVRL